MQLNPSRIGRRARCRVGRDTLRRAVLLCCIAIGPLLPVYFLLLADVSHFAWDYRAYYTAAQAALQGQAFVGIDSQFPGVSYVYPPVSIFLFMPQAAVGGWRVAFAIQTLLNVATAFALGVLIVRTIESQRGPLPTVDRILITAVCLLSAPVLAIFGQGQVDLLIALGLGCAFLALERGRDNVAGIVLGSAALVKVFPAVLGLWLVWRRSWRALGSAILTGLLGLVAGALFFGPQSYYRYIEVLAGRSRIADFAGTVSPNFFAMTLYRPLSQLLPGMDPHLYAPLSLIVLAPTTVLVADSSRCLGSRLMTYLVALVGMLLVSPASNVLYVVYVYFPLLSLLYIADDGRHHALLLAGTVALTVPVQPAQLAAVLTYAPLGDATIATFIDLSRHLMAVASVPLIGFLMILLWCTFRAASIRQTPTPDPSPVSAD